MTIAKSTLVAESATNMLSVVPEVPDLFDAELFVCGMAQDEHLQQDVGRFSDMAQTPEADDVLMSFAEAYFRSDINHSTARAPVIPIALPQQRSAPSEERFIAETKLNQPVIGRKRQADEFISDSLEQFSIKQEAKRTPKSPLGFISQQMPPMRRFDTRASEETQTSVVTALNIESFKKNLVRNRNVRTPITRWTEQEEVILQGIVVDSSLIYGNQASWVQIEKLYSLATKEYVSRRNLSPLRERTSCALKKHYRVMHNKTRDGELRKDFWYQVYHDCWMSEDFNKQHKLVNYGSV